MATAPRDRLRYSNVAIVLHWAIAALILYNLASGLLRPLLPAGFFQFHVSAGITILLLSVVRVAWRLTHRPPPMLAMKGWERGLAHAVHFLLYAAMLIVPFSGWALVSAKPPAGSPGAAWSAAHPPASHDPAPSAKPPRPRGPTMIWAVVKLPLLAPVNTIGREAEGVPAQRALRARIETFHMLGGWAMLALVLLHVAGALKHQVLDRQRELARMGLG
ncbi:cytochrome b [Sphingomonas immobilis]|uniref:Cytochrome b/b6 domain-containing protein n=1 Tax=Sphingomonas immobilis TaxID=3063997 RepID=A0ABT9A3X9_9SPHN|nr:cytochrome b/b6 domain-containing protein [Sphingomonas sp. CA1-15]MDO7843920.1 cytochrome b/b6 domain-containing protein [Sphingomonas sp. CA1-15]